MPTGKQRNGVPWSGGCPRSGCVLQKNHEGPCKVGDIADEDYEVEFIADERRERKKIFLLVKWRGWPESDNTWEPIETLRGCCDLALRVWKKLQTRLDATRASSAECKVMRKEIERQILEEDKEKQRREREAERAAKEAAKAKEKADRDAKRDSERRQKEVEKAAERERRAAEKAAMQRAKAQLAEDRRETVVTAEPLPPLPNPSEDCELEETSPKRKARRIVMVDVRPSCVARGCSGAGDVIPFPSEHQLRCNLCGQTWQSSWWVQYLEESGHVQQSEVLCNPSKC